MKPSKQTEDRIRQMKPDMETPAAMDSRILMDAYAAMPTSQAHPAQSGLENIWRILMKNKIKLTTAASILIGAILMITVTPPAYALEQTIAALHSVRSIHMRKINPQFEDEPALLWAEFFENGEPKSIRMHMPQWKAGADGPKAIIWQDDVATVWFKKKKSILRVQEKRFADQILQVVKEQDPKFFVQNLLDKQAKGQCDVQIAQPDDKVEPIEVTAVYLPDKVVKLVLYVDQATNLLIRTEKVQTEGLRLCTDRCR